LKIFNSQNWEINVMTPEELSDRLLDYAAKIIEITEAVPDTRTGRHVAGQLLRCGTSPAPN
jgi:hypothetical protein